MSQDEDQRQPGKIKTMEEFSAVTGLSRPTVSKYFNDPASVRPATRERIEKAIEQLDYQPNLFAVNFNRRRPKAIGMIVPSLIDPFYAALVEQVGTERSPRRLLDHCPQFAWQKVDGREGSTDLDEPTRGGSHRRAFR